MAKYPKWLNTRPPRDGVEWVFDRRIISPSSGRSELLSPLAGEENRNSSELGMGNTSIALVPIGSTINNTYLFIDYISM